MEVNIGLLISNLTEFINESHYTKKVIPNKELDSALKKVLKWALIILTLGLAFLVPLTMDFSKKTFEKLFSRKQPPIAGKPPIAAIPSARNASTTTTPSTSSPPPALPSR